MPLLLYLLTAAACSWIAMRCIAPMSRAAAILLVLLPLVFTAKGLVGDRVYGPIDHPYQWEPLRSLRSLHGIGDPHDVMFTDIYSQMFPWRRVVQRSLAEGRWPLWNPSILAGHLLAGSAQAAVYSPFTLLACLLPAAKSFGFTAAIAFFIAGAGAFLFAREIGCREGAAFVAAIGFMYSTVVAVYVLWPLAFSWAWFPLLILGTRRVVRQPGWSSGLLLAAALSLMTLSGHPETLLHAVFLGCAYAVLELFRRGRSPLAPVITAIVAGATALLVCAIYLLPVVEAIGQSAEYEYKRGYWAHEARGAHGAVLLAGLATEFLPYVYERHWIAPVDVSLHGETSAVGSIVLALAVFAVWRRRSAETWFFGAAALLCIAAAVEWAPLAEAFRRMPLFDITHNERLAFAAPFFLAVLAAMATQTIVDERSRRSAAVTLLIVLVLLAGGTWWMLRHVVLAPRPAGWGEYKVAAELLGLGAVIALLLTRLPDRYLIAGIASILLLQRLASDGAAVPSFRSDAAYPHLALFDSIRHVSAPFRIVGQGLTFPPGTNVFYGLEDARGYEAVTFAPLGATYSLWCQHQVVWFNRVDDLTRPFLSFLNVRYAIALRDAPVPGGWRKVAADRGSVLLENSNALERVFVPRNVTVGRQDGDSFLQHGPLVQALAAATDFRERAWIRADTATMEGRNGPGRVAIRSYRAGAYDLEADMVGDGWIVLSDCAWKGWQAWVDGRRVKMQRANLAFNAVYVPRGRHRIRVLYLPQSFVAGRRISAATLLLLVVAAAIRRRKSRPEFRVPSSDPSSEFRVPSSESRIPNPESRVP